ncbi:SRPBCC family protein [Conexibacter sp. SYSU D00693]|uniref:SRPBCC family protein n=1 Tax=Conexibacter sp. SYSU D00693 TaxID=2812560 RepID=UPI00196AC4E6|nr:SRPBCC family protein [Conexibacter sp. SYSU D00693]
MPKARRSVVVAADVDRVWRTVGDPHHLARWWPRVARVEGVDDTGFTEVLRSDKGATVRADFALLEREAPTRIAWRQHTEGTPFERVLAESRTSVALEAAEGGGTRVELALEQRLRGFSRFGGFMVRAAARKQLDDALAGLTRIHGDG